MKNKYSWLLLFGVLTCIADNSCKKEGQDAIPELFTDGRWELASVRQTTFTGNTIVTDTTFNPTCDSAQYFTFNSDGTCTYNKFDCVSQPVAKGQWSVTTNQLFLQSNMVCKDTTAAGSSQPFSNAEIFNLGHFSLVLITGDIAPNYSLTAQRAQTQYGFIREKSQ
jgi:hypothetical protein